MILKCIPGQDRWLEVSSVSNFESYQSNRLKLRFKKRKWKESIMSYFKWKLALPRIFATLVENNQTRMELLFLKYFKNILDLIF